MATYLPNVTDVIPEPSLFTPNFTFIDQMLRRRQGLYEQGFSQVNSAYNFVNRNATNPYSLKVRDTFLMQAKENLKNLATMDLSQQQNVNAARGVFEPFVKNRLVLMDMAYTAHMDQQEAIAESYRLKDGGKEFSEDNLQDLRDQRAAFAKDSISSVGNYYSNRRSFTPYYDWNKEFKEWFASYKPDKISIDSKDGLYKITEERGGATAQDLKLFFSSVASEKAKNQMQIEARVRLGNNPEQLASIYAGIVEKDLKSLNGALGSLDNQIKLTKNPQQLQQLKSQKDQLEKQKFELSSDIDKISRGDIDFIKNNSEKLAYNIYFDQAVSRLAKGLSWTEYKKTFSADEVALAVWKNSQEWARESYRQDREDARELMKLEGLPGGPGTAVTLSASEKDLLDQKNLAGTSANLENTKAEIVKQSKALTAYVANQLEKDPNKITWADITDYSKSERGKRDEAYIKYRNKILDLEADQRIFEGQISAANKFAENKVGAAKVNEIKASYKSKVPASAGGFTAEEIFEAVRSGNYTKAPGGILGQPLYVLGASLTNTPRTSINGKTVSPKDVKGHTAVLGMIAEAEKSLKNVRSDYNASLNDYFSKDNLNKRAYPLQQNTKMFKSLAGTLGGVTGVDDASFKQILLGGNNDAFFYVDNEQTRKGSDERATYFKDIVNKLSYQGIDARYDESKGLVYVKEKPGLSKIPLGLDFQKNYTPMERKLTSFGMTEAGNGWISTPFYPNGMSLDKKGNPLPSFQFKVSKVDNERMYYLYVQDQNTPVASKSSLLDIMDAAKNTQALLYEKGYRSN